MDLKFFARDLLDKLEFQGTIRQSKASEALQVIEDFFDDTFEVDEEEVDDEDAE